MRFDDLGINEALRGVLRTNGFEQCTPIQELAIPPALGGDDIVGVARTGSGKTLAFLIPIMNKLKPAGEPQALIICPTRELALQVGAEAEKLAKPLGLTSDVIYGGTSLGHQRNLLRKGLDIVVGTPGRLNDFINTGYLPLRRIRWLILDEADRMLDMGFIGDIDLIMRKAPMSRQTMLFSATLPAPIMLLAQRYMLYPLEFRIEPRVTVPPGIVQLFYRVSEQRKADLLLDLLKDEQPGKAIVFTSTRKATTEIATRVRRAGWDAHSISSDLSQANRERVIQTFRDGGIRLLVATDVAGRGQDIDDISHVFNYDMPTVTEDYIHRIGRTGRLDRTGRAHTLFTPHEEHKVREIEELVGQPATRVVHGDFDPGSGSGDGPARRGGPGRRGGPSGRPGRPPAAGGGRPGGGRGGGGRRPGGRGGHGGHGGSSGSGGRRSGS
jgi:ATP-dependent RNA helicase DeaD